MVPKEILARLPYSEPFLFVDSLEKVSNEGVEGCYTFKEDLSFYRGHFTGHPVTPGVLLTECCAQIGLVCLGLFIGGTDGLPAGLIALSSSDMEFYLPVYPGEMVRVCSEKVYFRFRKLKCRVRMYNEMNQLVCKGELAGMLTGLQDE